MVVLSVLISGLTLVLLSTVLYQGLKRTQEAAFDTSLNNYAVDIANATDFNLIGGLVVKRDALIDENKIFPFPLGQSFVQIRTIEGAVVLSSRSLGSMRLPITSPVLEQLTVSGVVFQTIELPVGHYRMINYVINRPTIPPLILQVAVPMSMIMHERTQVLSLLWTLIPLALLAALIGGLITARRGLGPVQQIIRSARKIQPHELSKRIDVPQDTETRDLAETLNDLLSRLQRAFESQEQFIADASHQLKTPLAIMRGEIDVYRKKEDSPLLTSLSQEINQLSKMVDDLLLLARFDSGGYTPTFERVRVDEILIEIIGQLDRVAKAKGTVLEFEMAAEEASDLETKGDFDLLRGLFFNLIENAIKYAPAQNGKTTVRLGTDGDQIRVDVRDNGPGISEEDLRRIFDRFYRGGHSQHQVPGVGLGLSIASRIAKFHGADLTVDSQPNQGATFTFRIKKF